MSATLGAIDDSDHYELLEVPRDARQDEIERAYGLVRAAYDGDSLAAYSIFDPAEAAAMLARIDEAWRVLSDPEARRAYDGALGEWREGGAVEAVVQTTDAGAQQLVFAPLDAPVQQPDARGEQAPASAAPAPAALPVPLRAFETFDDGDAEAPWDGARLRRARLQRGLDIDVIAIATKINPTYLRFLEEERFDDLPAVVYVRGFVASVARHLGLDALGVSRSYAARFEEHRRTRPRNRLIGQR